MEFINIKTCIIRLRNLIMHVFIKVLSYKLHDSTKIKDHSKSIADSILIFAGKLASCLFFWSLYCNTSVFRSTNRINRSCSDSSQAADAECLYSSFSRATGEKSMLYSLYCVSNQRCLFKTVEASKKAIVGLRWRDCLWMIHWPLFFTNSEWCSRFIQTLIKLYCEKDAILQQ